jgi:hypothetical protein
MKSKGTSTLCRTMLQATQQIDLWWHCWHVSETDKTLGTVAHARSSSFTFAAHWKKKCVLTIRINWKKSKAIIKDKMLYCISKNIFPKSKPCLKVKCGNTRTFLKRCTKHGATKSEWQHLNEGTTTMQQLSFGFLELRWQINWTICTWSYFQAIIRTVFKIQVFLNHT